MKYIIVALALFGADLAFAESVKLVVPGEHWSVRFDAPALTIVNEPQATSGHVYSGTTGRLNLSFHVSPPDCAGGDSSENLYKCFGMKLQQIPYIIDGSIAAHEAPSGVQVTYLMETSANERKVRVFNLNYVFAHNGKWGDLHISVVQPVKADLEAVVALMKSLELVDGDK
jgi:hypothetical protein